MTARLGETADPSWYPMVLETLRRDHPEISDEVWSTTITENAIRLTEEREARDEAEATA